MSWPEAQTVIDENRRELVIKGNPEIRRRFEETSGVIPEEILQLSKLNFLELAGCEILTVPPEINKMVSLTQLLLNNNKIESLPDEIVELKQMKVLDVSYNKLNLLPNGIGSLINLQTLNASNNKLEEISDSVSNLAALSVLNLSTNSFKNFPVFILTGGTSEHISDLNLSHNEIDFIPDDFGNLMSLKQLDFSDNKTTELPQTISKLLKLKLANYKSNPLKDRRLKKLIETDNSQKSIMDYIRTKGRKAVVNGKAGVEKGGKVTKRQQKKNTLEEENQIELVKYTMQILKLDDDTEEEESATPSLPQTVMVHEIVKDVRPYLVACVLRNIDLSGAKFRLFLSIQTDLHEHLCVKRTVATIATHDCEYLKDCELHYDARSPAVVYIQPLGRGKEISGTRLFRSLKKEAEETRKQKKRNQPTGIHKYLNLLEDKEVFPILYTKKEDKVTVISLPPLTNGDQSKIRQDSQDVFIEVTSSKSLQDCKNVMDALLQRMVESALYSKPGKDFYADSSDEEDGSGKKQEEVLLIQQVKISDIDGKLKVLYPSKTDLVFDKETCIKVLRPY